MGKRKKRLEKQIEGLNKQIEKHLEKLSSEKGRKDTTPEYWEKEIRLKFEARKKDREKKLERKKK